MKTKVCSYCGFNFDAEEVDLNGRKVSFQQICDPCCEKSEVDRKERDERERKEALEIVFWAGVPPLYRDTDVSLLNPTLAKSVLSWEYNPIGLGVRGSSGTQKSRVCIALLHKLHRQGYKTYLLKATDLTRYATDQHSNDLSDKLAAKCGLSLCVKSDVLLIDDLGKGKMTPSAEELLYRILDHRSDWKLPTIWNTNANSEQLHNMMSEDKGDAIMRRLIEFSKVISV